MRITNVQQTREPPACRPGRWRLAVGLLLAASVLLRSLEAGGAEPDRYLTGQFLVATAEMRDPRFMQTVIYMVSHDATGALGLVINRPLVKLAIADLLKGFRIEHEPVAGDIDVHYGGPVNPSQAFVIHSGDYLGETSKIVKDDIAVGADAKLIAAIVEGKGPREFLLAFGYAGWAAGQLEGEILAESWFTVPGDKSLLFSADADKKWRQATERRRTEL